jgi:esterase
MILQTTDLGEGPAAIILHGLFGTASNFATIQRRLAVGRRVLTMDLRNHGRSPHDPIMDYPTMAADVLETMASLGLERAALVGHSMGGKVVMQVALRHPERVARLLIADIAPVDYPPRYRGIADAMLALPLEPGMTRAAADAALSNAVPDPAMRQFLLSNLRFGAAPAWRIGLAAISDALPASDRTTSSPRIACCSATCSPPHASPRCARPGTGCMRTRRMRSSRRSTRSCRDPIERPIPIKRAAAPNQGRSVRFKQD